MELLGAINHMETFQNIALNTTKISIDKHKETISNVFRMVISFGGAMYFHNSRHPYCTRAPMTNRMREIIQVDIEVRESVFGDFEVMLRKILIRHKSNVMSKAIRPGITSWGIQKLIWKMAKQKVGTFFNTIFLVL